MCVCVCTTIYVNVGEKTRASENSQARNSRNLLRHLHLRTASRIVRHLSMDCAGVMWIQTCNTNIYINLYIKWANFWKLRLNRLLVTCRSISISYKFFFFKTGSVVRGFNSIVLLYMQLAVSILMWIHWDINNRMVL